MPCRQSAYKPGVFLLRTCSSSSAVIDLPNRPCRNQPEMPYEIDIQAEQDYVRVHVTGERRYGDAALEGSQAGRQIVEFCQNADNYRVLVVLNLRGRLSATDSYDLVESSKEYGWGHHYKLAFVDTNKESIDDVRFTETVAVNRAYAVRAFADEAEAIDWLRDGPA